MTGKSLKIGLLAMSGIRACDPELMALGLTLPGFVERSALPVLLWYGLEVFTAWKGRGETAS